MEMILNHYPNKPLYTPHVNSLLDQKDTLLHVSAIYTSFIPDVQLFKYNSQLIKAAKGKSMPQITLECSL